MSELGSRGRKTAAKETKEAVMIRDEVATIDLMLGCDDRCVLSCEALYTSTGWGIEGVSWKELYTLARERAQLPVADRDGGRAVAFMEGAMLAARLTRPAS